VPLLVNSLVNRFNGTDLKVNGVPVWCSQYEFRDEGGDFIILTTEQHETLDISRGSFSQNFIILACIFMALDVAWILMVWGAATVGTPTQSMGRDEYLRWEHRYLALLCFDDCLSLISFSALLNDASCFLNHDGKGN
jgi:hypothetical protein